MAVYIKNLHGEYYGTEIVLDGAMLNGEPIYTTVKVYETCGHRPSSRQLADWGYTDNQWNNNELVDNGCGSQSPIREQDLTCDSHYESDVSYKIAETICQALQCVDESYLD